MKFAGKIPKQPDPASSSSSASSSSPTSVLRNKEKKRSLPLSVDRKGVEMKKKKKRALPLCVVDRKKEKDMAPPPPLSPASVRHAKLRIQFAGTLLKAEKERLQRTGADPVTVKRQLEIFKRSQDEENQRAKAQLAEEKRLADLEAEKQKAQLEKERLEAQKRREAIQQEEQRQEHIRRQRQRRSERCAREKMEAAAACRDKPYCCTMREIGILSRCDHAASWSYMGGQYRRPLEQLGLFLKEDCLLKEVELEEGEIYEEAEEGEIIESRSVDGRRNLLVMAC